MLLVDTSVWIDVFRRGTTFQLESVAEFDEIVTCLPVIQELLQGFRDERAFRLARSALRAMPVVESPLQVAVFEEAVDLFRKARRAGFQVRSSVDCLIAACAVRHGLTVLHRDRDYTTLARVSPLNERRLG